MAVGITVDHLAHQLSKLVKSTHFSNRAHLVLAKTFECLRDLGQRSQKLRQFSGIMALAIQQVILAWEPIRARHFYSIAFDSQHRNILGKPWENVMIHYTLGHELGHGRFGATHLCTSKSTGAHYACKTIAKCDLHCEADFEKIRREIQIMHHLAGHENIVALKGAYENKESVHLVMELCEGGELSERIMKNVYHTERNAASLCATILRTVEICHSLGVMHRDLKPENILFAGNSEYSVLKVIDFGQSVFFKPGEAFTDTAGTVSFLAPEVLRDKYGPEADIWSAGVILYVLLSGVAPFRARTHGGIFGAILRGHVDLTSEPWPSLSDASKDLVRRMLTQDPGERITAAEALSKTFSVSSIFFKMAMQSTPGLLRMLLLDSSSYYSRVML